MNPRAISTLACACLILTGCATSKSTFYEAPTQVGTWSLCRTLGDALSSGDRLYADDVAREVASRGLSIEDCKTRNMIVDVGVVSIVVLGVVAAAMTGGGGGGGGTDSSFAWDQFQANNGQLMWACRGRQTGRFADQWRCSGLPMNDFAWPGPHL